MDLGAITRFRLRRVNPYRGLIIDESTWAEAHDYHRDHMRLHAIAFHSAGVIGGLDVRPTPSQAGSVDITAGAALDHEGNMIVVGQDRRVPFDGLDAGDVYVVLSYLENRVNADPGAARGAPMNRIVESYNIEAQSKPPEEPNLELARVRWSGAQAAVKLPADRSNPGPDELDLRFRMACVVARPAPVSIGLVPGEVGVSHLRGITHLVREIDNVAGYRAEFRGNVNLDDGAGMSDLIYICAPLASDAAITTLGSHLGRGGAILADGCAAASDDFARSIHQVADRLGLHLKPIAPGDPLLDARFPLPEVPAGANEGGVLSSGRFILSERDFGCAWSGIYPEKVLPRETVRTALEWGVNIAISSVQPPARVVS